MSRIKDPDVRRAIETLEDEFENLEASVAEKDDTISDLEEESAKLLAEVEELRERVKELEEALAEAYLTSESEDDGRAEPTE